MSRKKDLVGKTFTRLLVIEDVGRSKCRQTRWLCKCSCGKEVVVNTSHLTSGKSKSCGCLNKERLTTHGLTSHPLYTVWCCMKDRCTNPQNASYKNYGGRGITVCDRWLESVNNFIEDVSNGYEKGLELDRRDNNGNYELNNIRWVTPQQNNMNTRSRKGSTSNFKGVSWHKAADRWVAQISDNRKKKYLGVFRCEKDAAKAYNKAAQELFGEYAYLNIIEEQCDE